MQISSCFHISATFSTAKRLNGVLFRTLLFASSGHCNETSAVLATTVQEFEPPLHATHRFSRDFQCSKACASAVCVVQSKLEILTPFWLMSQRLIATLSMSGESQNVLGKLILSKYVAETRSISWVCYVFAQEQFAHTFWLPCTHEGVPISIFIISVSNSIVLLVLLFTEEPQWGVVWSQDRTVYLASLEETRWDAYHLSAHMFSHNTYMGRHVCFVTDWTESPVQIENCNQLSDCRFGTAELGALIVLVRLCHLSHHSQDSPIIVLCSSEWLVLKSTEPFLLPWEPSLTSTYILL